MRPISYRPVLRYRVPQPTRYISRETEGAAHEIYEPLAPAILDTSQRIDELTQRIGELLDSTDASHQLVTDYYTTDPLSEEGRKARQEIRAIAGGFRGDPNVRRALILEPMRLLAQQNITSALQVWGCDDPEQYGRTGLPQELFDRLAANEQTLVESTAHEAHGRLARIDMWSKRLSGLVNLIGDIQRKELSLESFDHVIPNFSSTIRNQIKVVVGQRMREIESAYWDALRRARQAVWSVPKLVGPAAIRENAVYEWADELVKAAEAWVEENPDAEAYAAEIVHCLGVLVKSQRRIWDVANEADQAVATMLNHALDAMDPFLRLQGLIASLD